MSKGRGSFFQRVIDALARGSIPIDGSQCDGPCVVNAPAEVAQARCDQDAERQSPIRWVNLR
jgi:hypothetical protein